MEKSIKFAAIAGIQLLVLGAVLTIINIFENPKELEAFSLIIYIIIYIFSLVFSIIYFWGFNVIGDKIGSPLLVGVSHVFIFSSIIFYIFFFIPIKPLIFPLVYDPGLSYPMIIFIGSIGILFGIGLLKLKNQFGIIAISAGILEIITSAGYLIIKSLNGVISNLDYFMINLTIPIISFSGFSTINLPIIPISAIMLAHILQLILLFKASKELE